MVSSLIAKQEAAGKSKSQERREAIQAKPVSKAPAKKAAKKAPAKKKVKKAAKKK